MLPEGAIVAVRVVDVLPVTVKLTPALALPTGKNTSVEAGPEIASGAAGAPCIRIGFGSLADVASQMLSALRS